MLGAIVERIRRRTGDADAPLRALVFDSKYDSYKGVVAYVRVVDGAVHGAARVRMMAAGTQADVLEVGVFKPTMTQDARLSRRARSATSPRASRASGRRG